MTRRSNDKASLSHIEQRVTQEKLIAALEPLVDASSVSDVVLALARVCSEKAEHLLANWQDKATAKAWDRVARVLDNACPKIDL